MKVVLKFMYDIYLLYIPNEYINNLQQVYMNFFDWIEEQPNCWDDNGAKTFDEKDFVRYLNEEVLFDCNERAYIITDNIIETKNITVLKL